MQLLNIWFSLHFSNFIVACTVFIYHVRSQFVPLTLSLRRVGDCCNPPPFSDFTSYHFCVFAKIAIWSIYPPFVQIPMYPWKNFSKIFAVKKVGGWGGGGGAATTPPPSWEGRGGSKNKKKIVIFIFLFCPFVIIMTIFLKYLRHKVDSVKCFTFNL